MLKHADQKKVKAIINLDLVILDDFLLHPITEDDEVKALYDILEKRNELSRSCIIRWTKGRYSLWNADAFYDKIGDKEEANLCCQAFKFRKGNTLNKRSLCGFLSLLIIPGSFISPQSVEAGIAPETIYSTVYLRSGDVNNVKDNLNYLPNKAGLRCKSDDKSVAQCSKKVRSQHWM